MDMALSTTNLTKRYGRVSAVDNLSLQVRQGEIYAFLGLNGAGKTTTIRMLLGMVHPTAGSARICGMLVGTGDHSMWREVGYLVESPSAYPELTVRENLEVVRRLRQIENRRAVECIMERLALLPYADRPARALSLGNLQRLGLAKAMLHEPRLLILDEPANGLDPAGVVEVRELLRHLAHERGVTIFMSSHVLGEVARLADRLGVLHQGRLLEELDAEALARRQDRWVIAATRDPERARDALAAGGFSSRETVNGILLIDGAEAVERPEAIARLLVCAGVPPTRLGVEQEDLETYFLRMTGSTRGSDR